MTTATRNKRLIDSRSRVVREARQARLALNHVTRLIEPASRESRSIGDDGIERFELVRLSDSEHLNNYRIALTWLQQAETHLRDVRVEIERALDYDGWRFG